MLNHTKYKILIVALLLVVPPAFAGLKDIRLDRLPHDAAVQKAYADSLAIEDMVRNWSAQWPYQTPKKDVVSQLKSSLHELQKEADLAPSNEELLLLTALVANYAYNVDVEGSHELSMASLERAQKLAPDDYRIEWFAGTHLCQTTLATKGMEKLLSIEKLHAREQLPSSFWDDYISCSFVTNMPSHALRAGDHAEKLREPPSQYRDVLIGSVRNQLKKPDRTVTYPKKDAWNVTEKDSRVTFTSSACGFRFESPAEWRINLFDLAKGQCIAQIETGPLASKAGDITPNILVVVRQPKPGETLIEFMKAYMTNSSPQPAALHGCPVQECLGFEAVKPGLYHEAGDGHAVVTVFKREAPEFPGVLFEAPTVLPPLGNDKASTFRPDERLTRFDGTLYYLVLLDSASLVLAQAQNEYESFLKGFETE